jgi:hypothetical protein
MSESEIVKMLLEKIAKLEESLMRLMMVMGT